MHLSFDQCCDDICDVCLDISGEKAVMLTLPDVFTQTDEDIAGLCPECEERRIPFELSFIADQALTIGYLSDFAAVGCSQDSDMLELTACGYMREDLCGALKYFHFAATYRTSDGDLRMFVGFLDITYTVRASDDFLLASSATKFNCLGLDHDGTLSVCFGTPQPFSCSVPSAYNVMMNAA